MAGNYVQPGEVVEVPAPEDVMSGAGVLVGSLFGVAAGAAATGEPLRISTRGVFDLPKVAADDIGLGDRVYWNAATKEVAKAATGNKIIGVALAAAGVSVTTIRVRLNGSFSQ